MSSTRYFVTGMLLAFTILYIPEKSWAQKPQILIDSFLDIYKQGLDDRRQRNGPQKQPPRGAETSIAGVQINTKLPTPNGYRCSLSNQFEGFAWCKRASYGGSPNAEGSFLRAPDGTVVYANLYSRSRYLTRAEIMDFIQERNALYGTSPSFQTTIDRGNTIIASWGSVRLDETSNLGDARKGAIYVDPLNNEAASSQRAMPFFEITSGRGYVLVARLGQGDGSIRLFAIDQSLFPSVSIGTRMNEREPNRSAAIDPQQREIHRSKQPSFPSNSANLDAQSQAEILQAQLSSERAVSAQRATELAELKARLMTSEAELAKGRVALQEMSVLQREAVNLRSDVARLKLDLQQSADVSRKRQLDHSNSIATHAGEATALKSEFLIEPIFSRLWAYTGLFLCLIAGFVAGVATINRRPKANIGRLDDTLPGHSLNATNILPDRELDVDKQDSTSTHPQQKCADRNPNISTKSRLFYPIIKGIGKSLWFVIKIFFKALSAADAQPKKPFKATLKPRRSLDDDPFS
jgi:hypothetical protein